MVKGRRKTVPSGAGLSVSENVKVVASRAGSNESDKGIKPSWRFSKIDSHNPFSFPNDAEAFGEIIKGLSSFESMTMGELRGNRKGSYAVYELAECSSKLNKDVVRLMADKYPNFPELHRFRIGSSKRVYAVSPGRGVFELLFWDPEHEIYPTKKQ